MNEQDFKRFEQIAFNFKEEVKAEFRHQIGIQSEFYQQKLDILVEGHRMLAGKIDRVETRLDRRMDCLEHKLDAVAAQGERNTTAIERLTIDTAKNTVAIEGSNGKVDKNTTAIEGLTAKLDAVAADLTAHRADTEAHPPLFRIKE
ncbi:MAG: hypothetical protein ACYC5X_00570 [Syntrophales bacterium]